MSKIIESHSGKIVNIEEGDSLYLQYLNYQIGGYETLIDILSSNEDCLEKLINEYTEKYIEYRTEFNELSKNLIMKYCNKEEIFSKNYDSIELDIYGTNLKIFKKESCNMVNKQCQTI